MSGAQKCLGFADLAMLSYANEVFLKSISVKMPKNPGLGKNSISFHFSHIGFVEKTDCKLSVSNGSANCLITYKMKNIFLLVGERWDLAFLDFEIWHFSITFLAKKGRFICFPKEKWNFTAFRPHLKRSLWLLLEKYADSLPSGKNPSDAHVS